MSRYHGEVLETPDEGSPYAALLFADDRIVTRAPVQTVKEGERLITGLLNALEEFARKGAH